MLVIEKVGCSGIGNSCGDSVCNADLCQLVMINFIKSINLNFRRALPLALRLQLFDIVWIAVCEGGIVENSLTDPGPARFVVGHEDGGMFLLGDFVILQCVMQG